MRKTTTIDPRSLDGNLMIRTAGHKTAVCSGCGRRAGYHHTAGMLTDTGTNVRLRVYHCGFCLTRTYKKEERQLT